MATRHFPDTESMLAALNPGYPVYCLRPTVLRARARWFVDHFPGSVLYAVKCNPHPRVLKHLHAGGIRHYDTASLPEIAQVGELFDDATLYFMHPVKGRAAIRSADRVYGVRHYVVDHEDELDKVMAETTHDGLVILVRLATPPAGAIFDLSAKFGARAAEAVELLKRIDEAGHKTGLAFHVGSQCVLPEAYRTALTLALTTLIHRHSRVIHHFQKWNHTLAFAICACNIRIRRPHIGPVIAQTACPFRQFGIVGHHLENMFQVILRSRQITR